MPSGKNGILVSKVLDGLATLLRQIIQAISTDSLIGSLGMGQFEEVIDELCEKAPDVAQGIADAIQTKLNFIPQRSSVLPTRLDTRKRKLSKTGHSDISGAMQNNESCGCVGLMGREMVVPGADALANTSIPREATSSGATKTDKGRIPEETEISSYTWTSSFSGLPNELVVKNAFFIETVLEVTETLHRLTRHTERPSSDFHRRILEKFRDTPEKVLASPTGDNWSDGSIWVQVLHMATAQQERGTIFAMLEYMGAWAWYNGQMKLTQNRSFNISREMMKRRVVASYTPDSPDNDKGEGGKHSRWISGVGQVTLQEEPAHVSKVGAPNVGDTQDYLQKKDITMDLKRGQKLSTKLVKELGLGILFHRKIWALTEMSVKKLNVVIETIKSNNRHAKLLHILEFQLECLVQAGHPDLDRFYADLRKEELLAHDELRELEELSLRNGKGNPPDRQVSSAVQGLIQRLGQNASIESTGHNTTFTVNGGLELSFDVLKQFLPGKWLDNWAIMTAMHISDKPENIRYDISIPLDEPTKHRGTRPIRRPLARWAKKIAVRREIAAKTPSSMPLVHFCPINHYCNHFTLLEINDKTKTIYHYDSLADRDVIDGRKTTRISKLIDEEFGGQGFSHQEIPTPQQKDGWSCGIRVVWTFGRRANDLPIGSWDRTLNPNSMIFDVLNGLTTYVEDTIKIYR